MHIEQMSVRKMAIPPRSNPSSPTKTKGTVMARSPFKLSGGSGGLNSNSLHSLNSSFGSINSSGFGGSSGNINNNNNSNSNINNPNNPNTSNKNSNNNNEPIPKRIRKMLEPLIMSIITTILVFHFYFSGDSNSVVTGSFVDSPIISTGASQQQQSISSSRIPSGIQAKIMSPPPSYNYHDKLTTQIETHVPIFYHIFIPQGNATNARMIVQEQLEQIGSTSKNQTTTTTTTTIFYQTIGVDNSLELNVNIIQTICQQNHIQCHHIGHYEQGIREEITLYRVQEFCKIDSTKTLKINNNNKRRVMYLHNKGSHHSSIINTRWRKKLTQAITHNKCLHPPMETCNICSLFLTAERGIFMAGNMWVAKCDYINKLLPVLDFEAHMERIVKQALFDKMTYERYTFASHKHWPPSFGTGRYAAENWVGSHPSIMPCDFSFSFKPSSGTDNTLDFFKWVNQSKVEQQPGENLRWTMVRIIKGKKKIVILCLLISHSHSFGCIFTFFLFHSHRHLNIQSKLQIRQWLNQANYG